MNMSRKKALSEEEQQKRLALDVMDLLTRPQFDKEGKERQRLKDLGLVSDEDDVPEPKSVKEKRKYEQSEW